MATIHRAIPVGGASLNFKVVGGTAEPANPKENTIWVNTDAEITGWAFAAGEPNDPVHGSVWIKTGNASPAAFNALKKNALFVYPNSAMQWDGSAWVKKETLVYKNGEWLDMKVWLLQGGNQYADVTGGWAAIDSPDGSHQPAYVNGSGIVFDTTAYLKREIATVSAVDFTGIGTLYFSVQSITNANGDRYLTMGINKTRSHSGPNVGMQGWAFEKGVANPNNATNLLLALDTSGADGEYYVLILTGCGGGATMHVVINEIYGV